MHRFARLYVLSDPITGEVRYIGWTSKSLEVRLRGHLRDAARPDLNCHRLYWIRALLKKALRPTIRAVALLEVFDGAAAERRFILASRAAGTRLVNSTDGGDGVLNPPPEVREKLAAVHRGKKKSPQACAAMSRARLGKKLSPEHRAAMRGKSLSPEHRAALLRANKGRRLSPEHRAAIGHGNLGKKRSPEERAAIARAKIGKRHSPETRMKMSLAQRGRKHSLEAIRKQVATFKASYTPQRRAKRAEIARRQLFADPPIRDYHGRIIGTTKRKIESEVTP